MPQTLRSGPLRVALVHDWLTGMRGGEKVLESFARLFPEAPIYTLVHVPGSLSPLLESRRIVTSVLQRLPRGPHNYRHYLPLFPALVERLRLEPVDLVLSCSSCWAKAVPVPAGAVHASYVLSPMRYLYDRYGDYFGPGKASLPTRTAMRTVRRPLQRWDRRTADRVDHFATLSRFVQQRIRSIYDRDSELIAPPVDVDRFAAAAAGAGPRDYYLIVSALVPYKKVDLAIDAFRNTDRRLIVAGGGPLLDRLRRSAPPNVELLGHVPDEQLPTLVAGCRAFLFPQVEDFGIAPVEAMAAGRPVVALDQGGAIDTVRCISAAPAPTGIRYPDPSARGLRRALDDFEQVESHFDPTLIAAWASRFGRDRFESQLSAWLGRILPAPAALRAA